MFKLKYLVIVMVAVLVSILCCGMTVLGETRVEGVSVAHITDLHYYPTHMSYPETKVDYNSSAFKTKSAVDMKLLAESSINLRATLDEISKTNPDYLVVTGDMSSDGERQGLIDVANALRALQNEVRTNAGNDNFQILVVPGNHDISNPNATDYSTVNGTPTDNVNRAEFSKIFAGLGFPDMTAADANAFYENDELNPNQYDKYLPYDLVDGSRYIPSNTSSNVVIKNYKTVDDMSTVGSLSYIMSTKSNDFTVLGLDTVLANENGGKETTLAGHNVSGELKYSVQDWISAQMKDNTNKNVISLMHHNLLEHFTMQEELMTDFVLNNYEQAREFLIGQNVKYNLSGHVHANDVASFVSYGGKTIYDITTSSNVGFSASYRTSNMVFNDNGSSDLHTTTHKLGAVDYSILFKDNILNKNIYTNNYEGILTSEGIASSAYDYGYEKIYSDMLDKMLSQVITTRGLDTIKSKLLEYIDQIPDLGGNISGISAIIDTLKRVSPTLIDNAVDQVNKKVLIDYEYNGDRVELQGEDNKILAIVYEMVSEIMHVRVAKVRSEVYDMQDLALFAYGEFLRGGESASIGSTPEWFQQSMDNLYSGEVVEELEDVLYEEYYPFVKKLLSENIDLSKDINASDMADINAALGFVSTGQTVNNINLDKLVSGVLEFAKVDIDGLISNEIENKIAHYMTKSSALKISDYIIDISLSMSIDTSHDGEYGEVTHVRYKMTDTNSHSGKPRVDIMPSVSDGRLPSMATVGFGTDPKTTKEFVWFTDKFVGGTDIQYMIGDVRENFNVANCTTVAGSSALYAYDYSLLDVPFFATSRTKEIARHSVSLSGLTANSSYLYRVGDSKSGYWSEVFVMNTAPDKEFEPFDILLISDMEGSNARNYNDINKVLNGASAVFDDGYDFIVNLGDTVDNANDLNDWRYALDNSSVFQNNTTVALGGRKDSKDYTHTVTDGYYPSQGVIKHYNTLNLHYNIPSDSKAQYYSFDYCGVHFTVLDTNDMQNNRISEAQEIWLKADLEGSKAVNKVVLMNKGIYTASKSSVDEDVVNMRESLGPIFSDNGVDIVLQGGDHVYSESYFLDRNGKAVGNGYYPGNSIANNNGGVLYVGMGTIGDDYGVYTENENFDIYRGKVYQSPTMEDPTFGKLSYDGTSISYQGYVYDMSKDKIKEIIDVVPWWAIAMIVTGSILLVLVIVLTIIIVLYNKGKIKLKFLNKYKAKKENKKLLKSAESDNSLINDSAVDVEVSDTEEDKLPVEDSDVSNTLLSKENKSSENSKNE